MRTIRQPLSIFDLKYPLEKIAPLEKILFIDIETTGFTAKSSTLYLIGAAYYEENRWYVTQWFASNYGEEVEILSAFFEFAKKYTLLIHFNGNNFDLPFLLEKCRQYSLSYDFSRFEGIDVYRRIFPYRNILKLPNCKLKTLEQFLGTTREDIYNGGELISVYHTYVKTPTDSAFQVLTLHNFDDMRGLLEILPILSYYDLFNEGVKAKKVQANYYRDINGEQHQELLMKLSLSAPLPSTLHGTANGCYFQGENTDGNLRIPLYEEEMKYFYSNYKNYYYLPDEDVAIHKSVASFVDKNHRTQAAASTCYTRKTSCYLPQWDVLMEPFFKRDYNDKELFFELTEDLKKDRKFFSKYATHILSMIAASY